MQSRAPQPHEEPPEEKQAQLEQLS